jgi:uncharacterized protein
MIPLAVGLAVLVGVSLGLLGGGGSILTVPLLVYVAGMDVKQAIPDQVLMVGFAVVMVAAGIAMLRGRKATAPAAELRVPVIRTVILALSVGLVSGLVGAGGGFLIVPALAMLGGLPIPVAVATSLLVITMQTVAGLAGHLASIQIDWRLAGLITAGSVVGGLVGGLLTARGYTRMRFGKRSPGWSL